MSDLLRERLQAQIQDVPVRIRGAATVRRNAELGQRHRRAVAATLVAVLALVVGTGALLGATGDHLAGPPAGHTPTPTAGPEVGGAFLAVSQLPTVQPFGSWTGSTEAKTGDSPMCLGQWPQATVAARRYTSPEPGRDGYQAVLAFPSADEAQSAVANAAFTLFACPRIALPQHTDMQRTGAGAGGGYITRLAGTTADPRSEVVIYGQAGRFVSLLWLAVPGSTRLGSQLTGNLADPLAASLQAATDRFPQPAPTSLAAAMLVPAFIPPEVVGAHPSLDLRNDPFGFGPLHSCDVDAARGIPQRQVTYFGGGRDEASIGQRVSVAPDPGQAQSVFTTLETGLRGCRDVTGEGNRDTYLGDDLHVAGIGDEAIGWGYEIRWPAPSRGAVTRGYVAVVRSGRAVMQVAWQGLSAGMDLAPAQFEAAVRAATDRLATRVPALAEPTVVATP